MYYVYTATSGSTVPTSLSPTFPVIYAIIYSCSCLLIIVVVVVVGITSGLTVACALRGVFCSVKYCLKLHFVLYHFKREKND